MNLIFDCADIKQRGRGLTFDDVLIVPSKSSVRSRYIPDLTTQLTKKVKLGIPFMSANMDTITEDAMAYAMHLNGGLGILHRFMAIDSQVRQVNLLKEQNVPVLAASIGIGDDFKERTKQLAHAGVNLIAVDIAHGHSIQMLDTIKWLKDNFPEIELIVGNVATQDGANDLIEAGADAIKVGIGPGSMCTTRIVTGCGVPQLTAIALCAEVAKEKGVSVIADGGMRSSGDVMKALAAGANCVMLGNMLAGTLETPGEIKSGKKLYRGMASKSAQVNWRGGVPEGLAAEGESTTVFIKGDVKNVLQEICGGIRSGMSYINATTISEVSQKAKFIEMSFNGIKESHAHGV